MEVLSTLVVSRLLLPGLLVKVLDLAIVHFVLGYERCPYHYLKYNYYFKC